MVTQEQLDAAGKGGGSLLSSCSLQFQIVLAIPALTAIACVLLRPFRSPQQTVFTVAISLLSAAIVAVTGLKQVVTRHNEKSWYAEKLLLLQCPLCFTATAVTFGMRLAEVKWKKILEEKKHDKKNAKKAKETMKKQCKYSLKKKRTREKVEERKKARELAKAERENGKKQPTPHHEGTEGFGIERLGSLGDEHERKESGNRNQQQQLHVPLLQEHDDARVMGLWGNETLLNPLGLIPVHQDGANTSNAVVVVVPEVATTWRK
jgi:hypothetical protein